jgi:hypothetical protein
VPAEKEMLARLEKFIALASGNREGNEARNAAVAACELITKHKLVILHPNDPRLHAPVDWGAPRPAHNPFPGVDPPDPTDPIWKEVARKWGGGGGGGGGVGVGGGVRPGERARVVDRAKPFNKKASWTAMRSRFGSHCQACLTSIEVGEFVYWAKEEGAVHATCFAEVMGFTTRRRR